MFWLDDLRVAVGLSVFMVWGWFAAACFGFDCCDCVCFDLLLNVCVLLLLWFWVFPWFWVGIS